MEWPAYFPLFMPGWLKVKSNFPNSVSERQYLRKSAFRGRGQSPENWLQIWLLHHNLRPDKTGCLLSPGSHEHSDNTSNPKWHARNHLHSLNWENPFSLMRLTSALNSISGHFGVTLQHNGMAYQGTTILVVLRFICAHLFCLLVC